MTAKPDQTRPDQNYAQNPVVAVVMSTYNGEKYLTEQIDSILSQRDVHVELFIRDDGSSDSTRDIITKFAENHSNIHTDFGNNIGWVKSFTIVLDSASGYDYYAFSDQDDVWKPDKLAAGIKAIKSEEEQHGKNFPVVWQSSHLYTDSRLNPLFIRNNAQRLSSLQSFLLRPYGRGNSLVFNSRVHELYGKIYASGHIKAHHDFWAVILAHAFGGCVISSCVPYVLYRQHTDNATHVAVTLSSRLKTEFRKFQYAEGQGTYLARELLKACGDDIPPASRKILAIVSGHKNNFMYRLKILFSPKFRTGDIRLTLLGKIKALFGLL